MSKRILIVNVNWIGDVIFSTPFIRAVREAYPGAHIACLVHPRCRVMLETNPHINEIVMYDEEGAHKGLIGKWRLIEELRTKRFDTAFLLHRSFTKALITKLAGIGERIGYATKRRRWLLTKAFEEPSDAVHKVDYFLDLARASGMAVKDGSCEFFVAESDSKYIRDLLARSGISATEKVAVLCPAGNWDPKRWPAERFAALGDFLAAKSGVKVVITAAAGDAALAEKIRTLMTMPSVVAAGATDLKQLGALLKRADLVVANDTGPMHMAAAVGAKTLALFGPTSPDITGPRGRGRSRVIFRNEKCDVPCYDASCRNYECMDAITVEEVEKEAERMLHSDGR